MIEEVTAEELVKLSFEELFEFFKEKFPNAHVWKQQRKGYKQIWVKRDNEIMVCNDGRKG